jgi:tight adherence protein C
LPILISVLCAATVFLLVMGLTRMGESAIRDARLGIFVNPELEIPLWKRLVVPWWNGLGDIVARYVPSTAVKIIAADLDRAGVPLRPAVFVAYRLGGVVVFATAAFCISVALGAQASQLPLRMIAAGIVGFIVPKVWLVRAVLNRQRAIVRLLPDSIDLLVVCVEAGLGLDAAMDQVVRRMSGPVAEEFKRTLDDIAIGRGRMDALRDAAQRTGVSQISIFVAALYQAELLGVSISQVLRVQSDSLRTQRNLRAREEAAKLPLKLLFPMVLCILPSMFVVVLAPGVIKLFQVLSGMGR